MYAVIKVGGKQQRVAPGDVIEVERQSGQQAGAELTFKPLLVVDDEGTTHLGDALGKASVTARLLGEGKGEKVDVVKYKNKTRYTRHVGHRQVLARLEVADISLGAGGKKAAAEAE